jgi:antitoxin VapB
MVVLLPKDNPWVSLTDSLDQFSEDFLNDRNQPQEQLREAL